MKHTKHTLTLCACHAAVLVLAALPAWAQQAPATPAPAADSAAEIVSFAISPRFHFAPETRPDYGVRAAVILVFPK